MSAPAAERFATKYDRRGPDECWPWLAGRKGTGYGAFWHEGRQVGAHVFAYRLARGPVPEGHDVHHTCRNRACVNPAHLETVTPGEHVLIDGPPGVNARKTHCIRGHELAGANLIVKLNGRKPNGPRWRGCRACEVAAKRARRARVKIARSP